MHIKNLSTHEEREKNDKKTKTKPEEVEVKSVYVVLSTSISTAMSENVLVSVILNAQPSDKRSPTCNALVAIETLKQLPCS